MVKGFTQQLGIDYADTFSPVGMMTTIKLVLGVAAAKGWHIHQLDINNVFFHGYLAKEVYMYHPPSYVVLKGYVCKLKKSLNGLKQASRPWNAKLTQNLSLMGFHQSCHCKVKSGVKLSFLT